MSRFLPFILGLLWPALVSAQAAWSVKFEPVFGVEQARNRYPEPARTGARSFFGLRVLMGVPLLSLELEATQANGRREYPSQNQKVADDVQRGMVGLRSTVPVSSWFAVFFRGGGRATKQKTTIRDTTDDSKIVKDNPIGWDPYAGTGVQVALASLLAVSVGATWFFVDDAQAEVQYSFGITFKLGSGHQ